MANKPLLTDTRMLRVNANEAEPADPDTCRPSDQLNLPRAKQTETGAEVSFIKDYHRDIYVAVSHAQNSDYDPMTGRGDIRSVAPIKVIHSQS